MTAPRRTTTQRRRPGPAIPQPDIPPPDEYAAAWAAPRPDSETWTPRPWVTVADRAAYGKLARQASPRSGHAAFEAAPGRDPVAIILAQEADRLQELLPLRHGRMASSSFAFYRGAPAVMAFDLSTTPTSQITVQASGDAHLSNFGLFASPERTLVFDSNDFDETLPGPVGMGRQAAGGECRHRVACQRLQLRLRPGVGHGHGRRISGADGALFGDATA